MATGILGTSNLSATTNTTVYTVAGSTFAVVTVSICNRSASTISVRLAASTTTTLAASGGTPALADYLEYGTQVLANGVLERSGIVLEAARNIVVYSSAVDVSVVVTGIETSTA
jgi:hypothetical protein